MLFSIIVPFYNSQECIAECIESVIAQDYSFFELILVDDGSFDESASICKGYLSDDRIKYFKKDNGGVGSARNLGILMSTGDYIVFLDSDDYLEKGALSCYSKNLVNESDFICSSFNIVTKKKKTTINLNPKKYSKEEICNNLYELMFVISATVGKVFKRSIIKTHNILFDTNYFYSEDTLFNLSYIKYCKKLVTISCVTYNIRRDDKNGFSLSTKCFDNIFDVYGIQYDIFVEIIDNGCFNDSADVQKTKYANKIAQTCVNYYLSRFIKTKKLVKKIEEIVLLIREKKTDFVFLNDDQLYFGPIMIKLLNNRHFKTFVTFWMIKHFPFVIKNIFLKKELIK